MKIVELLGLLAPVVGAVVLILYRRRAPGPVAIGLAGCVAAGAASVVGLVGSRAIFFGGGGVEGMAHRVEDWGLLRLSLVAVGLVLLIVAGCVGPHASRGWVPLLSSGAVAVIASTALRLVPSEIEGERGLSLLLALGLETVQFGILGLGVLVLCVAVVSSRPVHDERPEPTALAGRFASSAWRSYRSIVRRR